MGHLLFLTDGTPFGIATPAEIDALIEEGVLKTALLTERGFVVEPDLAA